MITLDSSIRQLRDMVNLGMRNPVIVNLAKGLFANKPTNADKTLAIYSWMKRNIKYIPESPYTDVYQPPATTVTLGAGDCEDLFLLSASLAKLGNIPVKAKLISVDGSIYQHIYPLLKVNGRFVPMDMTVDNLPMGREVSYYQAKTYEM